MISNIVKNPFGNIYVGSFSQNGLQNVNVHNFDTCSFDISVSGLTITGYNKERFASRSNGSTTITNIKAGTIFTIYGGGSANITYNGSTSLTKLCQTNGQGAYLFQQDDPAGGTLTWYFWSSSSSSWYVDRYTPIYS